VRVIWRQNQGRLDFKGQSRQCFAMNVLTPTPFPARKHPHQNITFERAELALIMGLYGRMVAAGEWRDYGMSFLRERAVFSVYRRAAEHPIYRVEKCPHLRQKQGQYTIFGMDGQVLKRGHDLKVVMRVLERKLIRLVD